MNLAIILVYTFFSLFIISYSIVQLSLVYSYLKNRKKIAEQLKEFGHMAEFPHVTVQLPVFNELYVIFCNPT